MARTAEALRPTTHNGRRLDWRPRYDEASRGYGAAAVAGTKLPTTGKLWPTGDPLDQGQEGTCVPHGFGGEAAAEPVPVPGITHRLVVGWYKPMQRLDEWDGEDYEGTSVLAGWKYLRSLGYYTGCRWAFTAEELAAAVVKLGPAVIGVTWRERAYETDALGVLQAAGRIVGGHCLAVVGYVPAGKLSAALRAQLEAADLLAGVESVGGDCFVILNSWGPTFGKRGLAIVPRTTVRTWFREGGEFCIPEGRKLPKQVAEKIAATAAPATAPRDHTLHLDALEVAEGDRLLDCTVAELGQASATVQRRRVVAGWGGDSVRLTTTAGTFTLRASSPVTVRRPVA